MRSTTQVISCQCFDFWNYCTAYKKFAFSKWTIKRQIKNLAKFHVLLVKWALKLNIEKKAIKRYVKIAYPSVIIYAQTLLNALLVASMYSWLHFAHASPNQSVKCPVPSFCRHFVPILTYVGFDLMYAICYLTVWIFLSFRLIFN